MNLNVYAALVLGILCCDVALSQRRVQQGGNPQNTGNSVQDGDTRLGLLAGQLGVAPVPGGGISTTGNLGHNPFGRDESCWCQPVNQPCTDLRPVNLDLVTRIINLPGSPNSQGGPGTVPSCAQHQHVCCPYFLAGAGNPGIGFPNNGQGFPNNGQGFPNNGQGFPNGNHGQGFQIGHNSNIGGGFGYCGTRKNYNIPAQSPTADFGEYPWMAVVLGPGNAYIGGGILISASWVLTAPHKFKQTSGLKVRLGDYDVGQANEFPQYPHFETPVSNVIIHPKFNQETLANDVALLKLAHPINLQQYSHIVPACLPAQRQLFDGQRCFVSGWGKDAFGPGQYQRLLQEVDVPVVESFRCENLLRHTRLGPSFNLDKRSFICAGGELHKDACQGDGGSPLVCGSGNQGWTVAGLVAWGVGCAQHNVPAAYVNIATYSNWINRHIN